MRRLQRLLGAWCVLAGVAVGLEAVPDKTVVLTFDDAVKSHRTYVAPMLHEMGFGATFFVTARWMADRENFMTWQEIAELHGMGFEVGNHSWSHPSFGNPKEAGRLAGQLALVENALAAVGVPKPTSFAWCGNGFSPEAVGVLEAQGYRFARRGMQPEVPYGQVRPGPVYDPAGYHPLLVPSAGDAYPEWTLADFKAVVDRARDGKIAVVQFHGVPDVAHPWVTTAPERFAEFMGYLKAEGFNVIALRDLARYADAAARPADAMAQVYYGVGTLDLPREVAATRANAGFWLDTMLAWHGYSAEEAGRVLGWPPKRLEAEVAVRPQTLATRATVLPYPGGRHPRVGFLDGAIDPLRGTKASVFPAWPGGGYVVVDVPEAVFSQRGLLFLSHTHVPTVWDEAHVAVENVDWTVLPEGGVRNAWSLPDGVRIGASVVPTAEGAGIDLWLENGTTEVLTGLRTQVCVLLKGLPGFEGQTLENKVFEGARATARSADGARSVVVEFERCGRAWGNALCPCIHADPVLPDCAPGARVAVRGTLRFVEGGE